MALQDELVALQEVVMVMTATAPPTRALAADWVKTTATAHQARLAVQLAVDMVVTAMAPVARPVVDMVAVVAPAEVLDRMTLMAQANKLEVRLPAVRASMAWDLVVLNNKKQVATAMSLAREERARTRLPANSWRRLEVSSRTKVWWRRDVRSVSRLVGMMTAPTTEEEDLDDHAIGHHRAVERDHRIAVVECQHAALQVGVAALQHVPQRADRQPLLQPIQFGQFWSE